jgi:prophage regulatory protein
MSDTTTQNPPRLISPRQLRDITGLSDPTIWRMRRRGDLPQPIQLSPGRVAWRADVINNWLETRSSK